MTQIFSPNGKLVRSWDDEGDFFNHISAGELLEGHLDVDARHWSFVLFPPEQVRHLCLNLKQPVPSALKEACEQQLGAIEACEGDCANPTWIPLRPSLDVGRLKKDWYLACCYRHGYAIQTLGGQSMTDSLLTSGVTSCLEMTIQEESSCAYTMMAEDPSNFLACTLRLEIQEQESGKSPSGELVCQFPKIADEQLKELVWHDVPLYGIIMALFQMKILEQLFKFGATCRVNNLVLVADGAHARELGIYRDFLISQGQEVDRSEEQARLVIPVNEEAFNDWMDFVEIVTLRFEQILCRGRERSLAIHRYLKLRGLMP